eukprot:scaffold8163_cov417-Prasinococcus_capsulatus_cf.AAC.2
MAETLVARVLERFARASTFCEARYANLRSAYDISRKAYASQTLPGPDEVDMEVLATTVGAMFAVNLLLSLLTKRGRSLVGGFLSSLCLIILLTTVGAIGLLLTVAIPYTFCYCCYRAVSYGYTIVAPFAVPFVQQGLATVQPLVDRAVTSSQPYLAQGVELTRPLVTHGVGLATSGWVRDMCASARAMAQHDATVLMRFCVCVRWLPSLTLNTF